MHSTSRVTAALRPSRPLPPPPQIISLCSLCNPSTARASVLNLQCTGTGPLPHLATICPSNIYHTGKAPVRTLALAFSVATSLMPRQHHHPPASGQIRVAVWHLTGIEEFFTIKWKCEILKAVTSKWKMQKDYRSNIELYRHVIKCL